MNLLSAFWLKQRVFRIPTQHTAWKQKIERNIRSFCVCVYVSGGSRFRYNSGCCLPNIFKMWRSEWKKNSNISSADSCTVSFFTSLFTLFPSLRCWFEHIQWFCRLFPPNKIVAKHSILIFLFSPVQRFTKIHFFCSTNARTTHNKHDLHAIFV